MPWFKVDDGFWSHPKTLQLTDGAQALWMRAGSWSMHHLTDGFIPSTAYSILSAKQRHIDELNSVSLWNEVPGGSQFHDWVKYQPTRVQVEADRHAAAERKRKSREKSQRDSHVTDGEVTEGVTPTPTRPDPTRPTLEENKHVQPAASRLLADFNSWWSLYPRKQGKGDAYKAYKAARKLVSAEKLEAAVSAYLLANIGTDKAFLKMPAGWLRGERWDDEQVASVVLPPRDPSAGMCTIHDGYPLPCRRCGEAEF